MPDSIVEADEFIDIARRSAAAADTPPDVAVAIAQALLLRSIAGDLRQIMNNVSQITARR